MPQKRKTAETEEQLLSQGYYIEGQMLSSVLTNAIAGKRDVKEVAMFLAKKLYGIDSVEELQNTINKNGAIDPAKGFLKIDGILGKNTLASFFILLQRDSLLKRNRDKYFAALTSLRKAVYPFLSDMSIGHALRKIDLSKLDFENAASLQKMLVSYEMVDYSGNKIKVDNILGKRTLFAFLAYLQNPQPARIRKTRKQLLGEVPKRIGKIKILAADEIDNRALPLTETDASKIKEVIKSPYKYGGSTLKGFDCSGLAEYVLGLGYRRRGVNSTTLYNNSDIKLKYFEGNLSYPLVLSRARTSSKKGHVVIDYGVFEKGGVKYHMILQAGKYGGIGSRGRVSFSLVPDAIYRLKYAEFKVLDNAGARYASLFGPAPSREKA